MNQKVDISPELEEKIREVITEVIEQAESDFECWKSDVDEIEHESRSGFWSWNNGGFDALAWTDLRAAWGSGIGNEGKIAEVIDSCLTDAADSFWRENEEKLKALEITEETCNYHDLYEAGHGDLAEEVSQEEDSWLSEGGEFWYQCRVIFFSPDNSSNESGKPEAYFMAGLNTDYGYGRDSGFDPSWSETVPLEDLTDAKLEEVQAKLSEYIWQEPVKETA